MDVTDLLVDLDVYGELTTEGSSRLSTVEVFDTAMQLRGLVQSMKSSVPPVPHVDDMLMYSHLRSSCTTSGLSHAARALQGLGSVTGQIDPTEKVAARGDAYTAG